MLINETLLSHQLENVEIQMVASGKRRRCYESLRSSDLAQGCSQVNEVKDLSILSIREVAAISQGKVWEVSKWNLLMRGESAGQINVQSFKK